MRYRFKKNQKVFVKGFGKNNHKYYSNIPATIVEYDSYYDDYIVRFRDQTEDWISSKDIRKPFERAFKKKRRRRKSKKKNQEKRS